MDLSSVHLKGFIPPAEPSVFATNTFILWILNLITFGIHGSTEQLSKQHEIKELKNQQALLLRKIGVLYGESNTLEEDLVKLLDEREPEEKRKKLDLLSAASLGIFENQKSKEIQTTARKMQVALRAILFLGLIFAN